MMRVFFETARLSAHSRSLSADAQCVGDAVDVVVPRGDQGDLKNGAIVESHPSKPFVVERGNTRRVLGQLDDIIKHDSFALRDRRACVILAKRLDELVVQSDPTQKLCVRLNSVPAFVG